MEFSVSPVLKTCIECSDSFLRSHHIIIALDTKLEIKMLPFKSLTIFCCWIVSVIVTILYSGERIKHMVFYFLYSVAELGFISF